MLESELSAARERISRPMRGRPQLAWLSIAVLTRWKTCVAQLRVQSQQGPVLFVPHVTRGNASVSQSISLDTYFACVFCSLHGLPLNLKLVDTWS